MLLQPANANYLFNLESSAVYTGDPICYDIFFTQHNAGDEYLEVRPRLQLTDSLISADGQVTVTFDQISQTDPDPFDFHTAELDTSSMISGNEYPNFQGQSAIISLDNTEDVYVSPTFYSRTYLLNDSRRNGIPAFEDDVWISCSISVYNDAEHHSQFQSRHIRLHYNFRPLISLNSSHFTYQNTRIELFDNVSSSYREMAWDDMYIQHYAYKCRIFNAETNEIVYKDADFVNFTRYRTINIRSLKLQNNSPEPVNVSLFESTTSVTTNTYERDDDYVSVANDTYFNYRETQSYRNATVEISEVAEEKDYYEIVEIENNTSNYTTEFCNISKEPDKYEYQGVFTFENDLSAWTEEEDSGTTEILDNYAGHDNVVRIDDDTSSATEIYTKTIDSISDTDQENETIETYMQITDSGYKPGMYLRLYDSADNLVIWAGLQNMEYRIDGSFYGSVTGSEWYVLKCEIDFVNDEIAYFYNETRIAHKTAFTDGITFNKISFTSSKNAYGFYAYFDSISYTWDADYEEDDLYNFKKLTVDADFEKQVSVDLSDELIQSNIQNISIAYNYKSNVSYQQIELRAYNLASMQNVTLNTTRNSDTEFHTHYTNLTAAANFMNASNELLFYFNATNSSNSFSFNLEYFKVTLNYFNRTSVIAAPSVVISYRNEIEINETNAFEISVSSFFNIRNITFWDNVSMSNVSLGTAEGNYSRYLTFTASRYYSVSIHAVDIQNNSKTINITNLFVSKISTEISVNYANRYLDYSSANITAETTESVACNITVFYPNATLFNTSSGSLDLSFDNAPCGWYLLRVQLNSSTYLNQTIETVFELYPINTYTTVYFSEAANYSVIINPYSYVLTNISESLYNYSFIHVLDLYDNALENATISNSSSYAYTPPNYYQCFISLANQRNEYIDWENYQIRVDDTQIYNNYFYAELSTVANISIYTRFNKYLTSTTHTVERENNYIAITLTQHSLKIFNQQERFIFSNITFDPAYYSSNQYWSEWIAPGEIVSYMLSEGQYRVNISEYETNTSTIYSYTLNGDDILLITSSNTIYNVLSNVQNVNVSLGNQITNIEVNITNRQSQINSSIVNVDINLSNVNSTLGTLLLAQNTTLNAIDNNITTLYIYTQNQFSVLGNNINSSFAQINSSIYLVNNSIYTAVNSLEASLISINNTISGNLTLILAQNEYLTHIYQYSMFSDFLDWDNATQFNVDYLNNSIDYYTFINEFRNKSVELQLRYNSQIETLQMNALDKLNRYLPDTNVEYRVYSEADEEYLDEWQPLNETTVDIGFYEDAVPGTPDAIDITANDWFYFGLAALIVIAVVEVLYFKAKRSGWEPKRSNRKSNKKIRRNDVWS